MSEPKPDHVLLNETLTYLDVLGFTNSLLSSSLETGAISSPAELDPESNWNPRLELASDPSLDPFRGPLGS